MNNSQNHKSTMRMAWLTHFQTVLNHHPDLRLIEQLFCFEIPFAMHLAAMGIPYLAISLWQSPRVKGHNKVLKEAKLPHAYIVYLMLKLPEVYWCSGTRKMRTEPIFSVAFTLSHRPRDNHCYQKETRILPFCFLCQAKIMAFLFSSQGGFTRLNINLNRVLLIFRISSAFPFLFLFYQYVNNKDIKLILFF